MKLDLINDIFSSIKENSLIQSFINELSKHLKDNDLENENEEKPIIEDILSKNNVTTGNENSIRWKFDNIVSDFAIQNFGNDLMYFVKNNKKENWINNKKYYDNNVYSILKIENSKIEEIEINKKEMPQNIKVNDVFKIEKNKYIVDTVATKNLREKVIEMSQEIINKQNINLNKHRKEGHLYFVSQEIGNNRFLWDLTDKPKYEFEEVDIPKELKEISTEGTILKFNNGKYEYYSSDGFEHL